MNEDVVAFDLETWLITRLEPAPKPVCISWCAGTKAFVSTDVRGELVSLLDSDFVLVGHNVAYDFGVAIEHFRDLTKKIFAAYRAGRVKDTMIRQQLYDIASGRTRKDDDALRFYTLAALVEMIFDRSISQWKSGPGAWRLRYRELDGVPLKDWPEAAVEYPKIDASETFNVFDKQESAVGYLIREDAFQAYAAFCLHLMAARGIRTCGQELDRVEDHWRGRMEELTPILLAAGLLEWGGTKKAPKLVKKEKPARERMKAVCEAKGVPLPLTDAGVALKRKGGDPTQGFKYVAMDKAACLVAGDELMHHRADYVLAEKMLSTYVPALRKGTRRPITTGYSMAATTRTTSAGPRKPAEGTNLQNAPNKGGLRECIVPRKGYYFVGGDFSGAELHCWAQVCKEHLGFSSMGDALNAGIDVHAKLAARMAGRKYEDLLADHRDGCPEASGWRTKAKAGNFGYSGLMGPAGFVTAQLYRGVVFSLEDATFLRESWLAEWLEADPYFEWVRQSLGPSNDVTLPLWPGGPLRRFRKATQLANGMFQARAARGCKQAICDLTYKHFCDEESTLYHAARPVLCIHDEVVAETLIDHPDIVDVRVREYKQTMEDAFNQFVPDYPTTVDPALSLRGYKGKTLFDEQGRYTVEAHT